VGDIDPGSTRDRRFIVLETPDSKLFVGPDNGLFTEVIHDLGLAHAYQITNQSLMNRGNESTTFQGLSVYGPVAAHLAGGVRPEEVGPEIKDLVQLPVNQPEVNGSRITGSVVHVDHYGNLITNIPGKLVNYTGFVPGLPLRIKLGNQSVNATLATTYGDVATGQWLALISSDGAVEVARNLENAAKTIGASAGEKVTLSPII
jgi:S-adenosylmethionine hydrolase